MAPSAENGSGYRIVLTTCGDCKKTTRETREGSIEVDPKTVERIACDTEILDIRKGPAALSRTIPPKIANFVAARDKGRCRVPLCKNRGYIDRHHEGKGGWHEVGHDRRRILLLCTRHHGARHLGQLGIDIVADGFRFFLADGNELVEKSASRKATLVETPSASWEATHLGNESASREALPDPEMLRAAISGLQGLEFDARTAKRLVAAGLEKVGPHASLEDLLRAALQSA